MTIPLAIDLLVSEILREFVGVILAAKVAVLFKELRAKLDRLLADKIKRPDLDLWEGGKPVVDAILQLLDSERSEADKAGLKLTGRK